MVFWPKLECCSANLPEIGLTLPDKMVFKILFKKSAKVWEFSSQYFPRFLFPNRPLSAWIRVELECFLIKVAKVSGLITMIPLNLLKNLRNNVVVRLEVYWLK